jgi:carbamoyl-phosphate synthase/aspartate carbamoyltransferase/dihydroorotase
VTRLRIPAPLDPHVHLRDLDWSHKATVERETAAALAGGYWAVLDMPNTPPTTTSGARLDAKSVRFSSAARCDFGLYLGADQHAQGGAYAAAAGRSVGLKVYCDQTTGDLLVAEQAGRRRHLAAWQAATDKPVAVHAEGATVAALLALVRELRVRVHFCHISSADEMAMLRAAKRDGLPVSIGVTPHHLYLTATDAARLGSYGLVKPALKTAADLEALWEGIRDGTVDVVESDHAPHTRAEKESGSPPYGLPGLETTLPLLLLAVREGRITAERLIELVSTSPRRIFGLQAPAETDTSLDPHASWVVEDAALRTSPGWSPFHGMRLWGRVREVRIRGVVAFDGERVLAAPGSGRDLAWS